MLDSLKALVGYLHDKHSQSEQDLSEVLEAARKLARTESLNIMRGSISAFEYDYRINQIVRTHHLKLRLKTRVLVSQEKFKQMLLAE